MKDLIYRNRLVVVFIMTSLIILGSLLLAYAIRFDFSISASSWQRIGSLLPAVLVIKLAVLWQFGCFKGWWRYVSMPDLVQIVKASILGSVIFVVYAVLVYRLDEIPRSVLILDGIFCFLAIGGIRFATRAFREHYLPLRQGTELRKSRALIIGAGDAGQLIAREIHSNPQVDLDVIGFIDDDPVKYRGVFQGISVLGSQEKIKKVVDKHGVNEIIIAIPSAPGKEIRAIVERCQEAKVKFKILPFFQAHIFINSSHYSYFGYIFGKLRGISQNFGTLSYCKFVYLFQTSH